jgi:hypothetical protein
MRRQFVSQYANLSGGFDPETYLVTGKSYDGKRDGIT